MAMTQLVSYNFSTIENPLSNGGKFSTIADAGFVGSLQAIVGNLCEPVAISQASGSIFTGRVWPANQYSELTLTTFTASVSTAYLLTRVQSPSTGTRYTLVLTAGATPATSTYSLVATVANVGNTLIAATTQTITQADVWRSSISGNVITISQNGSVVTTFTDTNNFITGAGSTGFGMFASSAITASQTSLWAGGAAVNQVTGGPFVITSPSVGVLNAGVHAYNIIWSWGAATDTFTLKDSNGNVLLTEAGITTETTGMWASATPITAPNGVQVSSISVTGNGALYIYPQI